MCADNRCLFFSALASVPLQIFCTVRDHYLSKSPLAIVRHSRLKRFQTNINLQVCSAKATIALSENVSARGSNSILRSLFIIKALVCFLVVHAIFSSIYSSKKKRKISLEQDINNKRKNYLEWDEYFMAVAFLAAMRSKDPCTQVGACIVNENKKIVGIGYNGMPIGCSDDEFPWAKENENKFETKYLYVCHAELNAIINKNAENIQNCILYVGLFPCNECAKVIIQSGIKKIYYISDKHALKHTTLAAKRMFDAAKIEYRQYKPINKKIVIDFSEIDWNEMTQLPPTPIKNIRC